MIKTKIFFKQSAYFFFWFFLLIPFLSCGDDLVVTQYDGVYSGTYSGDDSGTWSVTIINGKFTSSSGDSRIAGPFTISGSVNSDGSFTATSSTGAKFSGKFTGDTVNGHWKNELNAGTFTGTKK